MKCPRCDSKTRVTSSRTAFVPQGCRSAGLAKRAVSWFTEDWVSRVRCCTKCNWRDYTVEICIDDLKSGWKRRP